MSYKDYLVKWIKEQVLKANCKGVVVGLSGGVDSSVVATLGKEAFPNNSLGIYLPINDMAQDLVDAKLVADKINIKTKLIDLTDSFKAISKVAPVKSKLAITNMKPRLRMTALYAVAQENNYLVLGTDNAAEWILGYFTKHGDGGVDLLPIVNLTKGEVKQMAQDMDLPQNVWTKKPSAALWEGQNDEDELGFSYDEVDKFINGEIVNKIIRDKIQHQINITEHKRIKIPTPLKKENID
ncbi:NAD(+) synthase [Candidatus Mycoplasma mahonii]|uniref:NAD(+) synthase n=1 Tax=Candidatus Mycoplasma mahonii TaxID=3004105 RepID=UPI0026ED2FF3|nr:NAD(+) synthase [Candidatus Mycoplasma mahonii]WKX02322.1 NAD(+) synthase [Candidatus Mycoplasma mahonii]